MIWVILVISFFLENIFTNYINIYNTLYLPLFSVVSLIIVYPFFKNNNQKYYITAFIFGLIYDIAFTNTILFNAVAFFLVAHLIKQINLSLSNNPISVILMTVLSIVYYRLIIYISLVIVGYLSFNLNDLFTSITSSLLINIIYGLILYSISDYISKKYRILKID